MQSTKPSVSLIISTYNWKEALKLSVESALKQSVQPDEIIIADDGSRDDTRLLVESLKAVSSVPIVHIWHEDIGFRLTTIRNKAIAASVGDYIIQIDGDIILHRHFIKDHVETARPGCFVCGSRVGLDKESSSKIFKNQTFSSSPLSGGFKYFLNNFRFSPLRRFLAPRYGQKKVDRLRGCNMAFWKMDLVDVNGYNETLTSWGHEDAELAYRLIYAGKKKRFLKMGGIAYHLWHPEASKDDEAKHHDVINQVKLSQSRWCEDGLRKYLKG
ncbi:glycosyltransferase family 2 protein [Alkaliflexus imshenetskii]|uniref:glycosyltransferase family 2 protein n=1 Tax=Alkaliflexus imshenetskii TaxID=286730 RepID=UPI00047C7EFF|nr:glycosyltransferase family 2 protein [Alkaliflexus imshenetskii]